VYHNKPVEIAHSEPTRRTPNLKHLPALHTCPSRQLVPAQYRPPARLRALIPDSLTLLESFLLSCPCPHTFAHVAVFVGIVMMITSLWLLASLTSLWVLAADHRVYVFGSCVVGGRVGRECVRDNGRYCGVSVTLSVCSLGPVDNLCVVV
jgi:hypothetical protein